MEQNKSTQENIQSSCTIPSFPLLKCTRQYLLNLVDGMKIDQLNKIPEGHSNNIVWNLGHIVYSQLSLFYKQCGREIPSKYGYLQKYKSGTRPEEDIPELEINEIKHSLQNSLDEFENDYCKGFFEKYNTKKNPLGFEMTSINDALITLLYHDGVHAGRISLMKRLV